ncbi:MAG TPA: 50S ribosomal protein L5 [Rickettsiales bacterium]|nr:50S ribosomal protein L5 [Rickettsiales bacterium]
MSFIKEKYKEVAKNLKAKFGYKNALEVPRFEKVCLNVAFKSADVDNNFLTYVVNQLSAIAGQKAVLVKAKKSISTFKLREGMSIACRVTLRKDKMYEFLDRLLFVALPRIKDFRGLSGNAFNQSGHYSFGIKEHTIFPEVELDKAYKIFGIDINVVTTAKNKEECKALLSSLLFPIK